MLYALGRPASFAVLLFSFVLGLTLHGWVQAFVADRMGDRGPRLHRRLEFNPQRQVDPFGALAGLVGGVGWAAPVELAGRRQRGRTVAVALSGPLANLVLGVGLLVLWRALLSDGASQVLALGLGQGLGGYVLQHGVSLGTDGLGVAVLLVGLSQLYLGVLSLVPLPPLTGGRLLFALAPRTAGWQRAEYYLITQNIGIALVLVLVILPLGGDLLLPRLLDEVLAPLLRGLLGV